MATAAQKKASEKYDLQNTRQITLKLNLTSDADILMKLDETHNRQGYIKQLIRDDLKGSGQILTQDSIRMLIQPIAKKYNLNKVYLFGSYARGDATIGSDIDLMIEDEHSKSFREYQMISENFRKATGKEIDLVEYDAAVRNHTRAGRRFLINFEKDKVLLYG